jgi:hypothetical protein
MANLTSAKYLSDEYWDIDSHPLLADLPLIKGSPVLPCAIVLAYFLFVRYLGPWLMRDRELQPAGHPIHPQRHPGGGQLVYVLFDTQDIGLRDNYMAMQGPRRCAR